MCSGSLAPNQEVLSMSTASTYEEILSVLAAERRILPEYLDNDGIRRFATVETKRQLLTAMGHRCTNLEDVTASLLAFRKKKADRLLEPVALISEEATVHNFELCLPERLLNAHCQWCINLETGGSIRGDVNTKGHRVVRTTEVAGEKYTTIEVDTSHRLPLGYHELVVVVTGDDNQDNTATGKSRIIVYPERCYVPDFLQQGEQAVTLNLQLNSLRSKTNFGIGNLGDVAEIARAVGPLGVHALGLSPLHPPQPDGCGEFSPYLPASREAVSFDRIDILEAAQLLQAKGIVTAIQQGALADRVQALRDSALVDEKGGETIFEVLSELHSHFLAHRNSTLVDLGQDFDRFVKQRGQRLYRYATYAALRRHLKSSDWNNADWRNWPVEYQNPNNPEVHTFCERNQLTIDLFLFIEWLARIFVEGAQNACRDSGMRIGLYVDLALSCAAGGAETWMCPELFVMGATVGFPPDALGPQGQNIGSPPADPEVLREIGYDPWISMIRYTMDGAGAIRLDHYAQVERLLFIPVGMTPADGAYVQSYRKELVAIICLESHRQQCLVVGEDLGTVPDVVRTEMGDREILSYRVVRFERKWGGDRTHIHPEDYPRNAMSVITTHDLALLSALWSGSDITLRDELRLDAPGVTDGFRKARVFERQILLDLLVQTGLIPREWVSTFGTSEKLQPELLVAIHNILRLTPCRMVGVELGDATGLEIPYNVPGTGPNERPANWRVKQPIMCSELLTKGLLRQIIAALTMKPESA